MVIGHRPPPVTGENLCRARLVEELVANGVNVLDAGREFKVYCRSAAHIIVCGESILGTAFDIVLTIWALLVGARVYWYFHNSSWRRFVMLPRWDWAQRRIVSIVLTDSIRDAFLRKGYSALVLNNRVEDIFETVLCVDPKGATRRLIWMGRPDVAKGFPQALRVFALLRQADAEWRFDVYGADIKYAKINGFLSPGVTFHGFISGVGKVSAFDQGGVFILPSRYKNETQPLSIIESLSRGIPVVASSVGGISCMLSRPNVGRAGYALDDGSDEQYVNAILGVLSNYESFSFAASLLYEKYYSAKLYKESVRDLFLKYS